MSKPRSIPRTSKTSLSRGPQIKAPALPEVQYIDSGMLFFAYANERSLIYANLFAKRIIQHMMECRIILYGRRFQTDNGSEFIGAGNAKDISIFTKTGTKALKHSN